MASRFLVPFASGRGLMGGDPLLDLHREMNRLFDDVFRGSSSQGGSSSLASMPRLDMHESDNELCVTADLPGVTPADVDLQIDRDVLTISGERKGENEQKQQNYHLMERSYGRFQRQVQLPFAPDPGQVRANFEHGVLTVRIPRQAEQQRSRRIEVRTGGEPSQQSVGMSGGASAGSSASQNRSPASGNVGQQPPQGGGDGSRPGA
jgi:HSP20 family protein